MRLLFLKRAIVETVERTVVRQRTRYIKFDNYRLRVCITLLLLIIIFAVSYLAFLVGISVRPYTPVRTCLQPP